MDRFLGNFLESQGFSQTNIVNKRLEIGLKSITFPCSNGEKTILDRYEIDDILVEAKRSMAHNPEPLLEKVVLFNYEIGAFIQVIFFYAFE